MRGRGEGEWKGWEMRRQLMFAHPSSSCCFPKNGQMCSPRIFSMLGLISHRLSLFPLSPLRKLGTLSLSGVTLPRSTFHRSYLNMQTSPLNKRNLLYLYGLYGWLGSRVVSVLDSGAEGPGFKSLSRRCRVTVLGKLFTLVVPLFTKQRDW